MADFQSDVPEQADQAFEARGEGGIRRLGQQQQEVDIRRRVEFAAPVAADGDEGEGSGQGDLGPEVAQDLVDQAAAPVQQRERVAVGEIGPANGLLFFLQARFEAGNERLAILRQLALVRRGVGCRHRWPT